MKPFRNTLNLKMWEWGEKVVHEKSGPETVDNTGFFVYDLYDFKEHICES